MKNILVFGSKWNLATKYEIDIRKEGKYLYLSKPWAQTNTEYRMDLTNGEFERINHYKTAGVKITPVKVKNITGWFTDCSLYCNDEKFSKVIIYNKYHGKNRKYKNGVRFIQALNNNDARNYEAWLSLGVNITDVDKKINDIQNHHTWNHTHYINIPTAPQHFSKEALKYIKKHFDTIPIATLAELQRIDYDYKSIKLIDTLYDMTSQPKYREFFTRNISSYNRRSTFNIFDLSKNTDWYELGRMRRIISCIIEFNLDLQAFLDYLIRLYNVEGLTLGDLFGSGNHYYDYLDMEKTLKYNKLSKVDKYPKYFLTMFNITKKEYNIRKTEFDNERFKTQCNKHRHLEESNGDYNIVVPHAIKDIENEADELKHCVRSYIPRVIDGTSLICFLRHKDDIDKPLVTIEVRDGCVTQAYGYLDKKPKDEELEVLRLWAKKHQLRLLWGWD